MYARTCAWAGLCPHAQRSPYACVCAHVLARRRASASACGCAGVQLASCVARARLCRAAVRAAACRAWRPRALARSNPACTAPARHERVRRVWRALSELGQAPHTHCAAARGQHSARPNPHLANTLRPARHRWLAKRTRDLCGAAVRAGVCWWVCSRACGRVCWRAPASLPLSAHRAASRVVCCAGCPPAPPLHPDARRRA